MFKLEKLYMEYKQDVFSYLVSLTHNPNLSEDLLSDTFLSAIKSIHTFRGNSSIKTWLFSIARYKWFEHLRKENKNISLDELSTIYMCNNFENNIINKEISKYILKLLDSEDKKIKDIVLLRINGFSYYEISAKLNISEGSARVIDFRAKKKIKEIMIKEGWLHD